MDAKFYVENNPFKKPERQNESRIKWTIGVLLSLGLLAFWMHRTPESFDQRHGMEEARGELRPLVGTTMRPSNAEGIIRENKTAASAALNALDQQPAAAASTAASTTAAAATADANATTRRR